MKKSNEKTDFKNKLFSSKLFLFCLLLIFIGMILSVVNVSYKRYLFDKELIDLKAEIGRLQNESSDLGKKIEYLNSREFLEKEARQNFNLKKEGENVIIAPQK